MNSVRKLCIVGLIVAAIALGPGQPAGAHSTLLQACPTPAEVTNEFTSIELTFETELVPADQLAAGEAPPEIFVATSDGRTDLEIGPTILSADNRVLTATVPTGLEPGVYTVRYEAVSVDADLNDGGFTITYDPTASNTDSCGVGDTDGSGGSGGLVLLAIGVVGLGAVGFLLRPRAGGDSPAT